MIRWLLGIGVLFVVIGLIERRPVSLPHRPEAQSWDQERLKKNDTGCPTSIYTVIDGELVQCPPYSMRNSQ